MRILKVLFLSLLLSLFLNAAYSAEKPTRDPSLYYNEAIKFLQLKELLDKNLPDQITPLIGKSSFGKMEANIIAIDNAVFSAWPALSTSYPKQFSATHLNEAKIELRIILFIFYGDLSRASGEITKSGFKHLESILISYLTSINKVKENSPGELQSTFGNAIPGFGFDENAIIYGITDFALKRAKEELLEAHLKGWYEKLDNDTIIKSLLPNTLRTFKQFNDDNSLNMAKYGDIWKAAFQQDLRRFPVQLQDEELLQLIVNKIYTTDSNNTKQDVITQIIPLIAGTNEIAYNLYLKKHFMGIIYEMSERYKNDTSTPSASYFKRAVIGTDVFSALAGTFEKDIFFPADINIIKNLSPAQWDLVFKLFYLRNKSDLNKVFDSAIVDTVFFNYQKYSPYIKEYITAVTRDFTSMSLLLNKEKSPTGEVEGNLSFEDAHKLFDLSFSIVNQSIKLSEQFGAKIPDTYTKKVVPIVSSVSEIGEGISTKTYGKVLDGSIAIINLLAAQSGNNAAIDSTILNVTRYGSFMVNILSATTAEDVEKALDEMIPKGQYKLKNATAFSASLSMYPGGFFGGEFVKSKTLNDAGDTVTVKSKAASASFYLPIGIDFNVGFPSGKSSINFFIYPIDLGAVLNYRITNTDSVAANPVIGFKQLLSPGFNVMIHLPKSPVVLGAGINYAPNIRNVTDVVSTEGKGAFRYGLMIGVDVTALHISLSKKKYHLEQ